MNKYEVISVLRVVKGDCAAHRKDQPIYCEAVDKAIQAIEDQGKIKLHPCQIKMKDSAENHYNLGRDISSATLHCQLTDLHLNVENTQLFYGQPDKWEEWLEGALYRTCDQECPLIRAQ